MVTERFRKLHGDSVACFGELPAIGPSSRTETVHKYDSRFVAQNAPQCTKWMGFSCRPRGKWSDERGRINFAPRDLYSYNVYICKTLCIQHYWFGCRNQLNPHATNDPAIFPDKYSLRPRHAVAIDAAGCRCCGCSCQPGAVPVSSDPVRPERRPADQAQRISRLCRWASRRPGRSDVLLAEICHIFSGSHAEHCGPSQCSVFRGERVDGGIGGSTPVWLDWWKICRFHGTSRS